MSKRHADIVILAEDTAHLNFIRHYLKECNYNPRKIRPIRVPHGTGAGDQFVLEQYGDEVTAYRSKANYLSVSLVVLVDADHHSVEDRLAQLAECLERLGAAGRGDAERIALLVPKRNIHTWIVFLAGYPVEEESDFKRHAVARHYKEAGRALGRQALPNAKPASLESGIAELRERLPGR